MRGSTPGAAELDRGERPLVSMEGWARFEQRARQRRIERRLEAARTAIRAGRFADARAALDELQELDPSDPQIQALTVQLAQPVRPRSRRGAFAVAALAFVTVLLAASWIRTTGLSPSPSTVVTAAVSPVPGQLLTSRDIGFEVPVATSGAPETFLLRTDIAGVPAPMPIEPPPLAIEPPPAAAAPLEAPPFEAPELAARIDLPPAPVSERAAVAPSPVLPPPEPPQPPSPMVVAATPTPTAAAPIVAAVVVDDAAQVRAVLQKYQTAYERLDAGSVQAVWPGVNQTALARAFEGLESQSLTFKACDVQLRGLTAAVVCTGSTRYVPKVGSHEPRVEPLAWNFTLRKNASEWQIESARAER